MAVQLDIFGKTVERVARKKRAQMADEKSPQADPKSKKETQNKKSSKPRKAPGPTKGSGKRLFPLDSLENALAIPQVIKEKNGGNPFDATEVAKACVVGVKTPSFFYLTAASKAYGLTEGTSNTEQISLTDLGRSIMWPDSAEQKQQLLRTAFFTVPIFKEIYDHYKGGTLPEMAFLEGRLLKANVPQKDHSDFVEIFKKNYDFLRLSQSVETLQKESLPSGEVLSVVGQSAGAYKHHAFVIMPFSEKGTSPRPKGYFTEMLNSLLIPACNALNFRVSTANVPGSDLIHHTIVKNLIEADLVVADLTDHNPNVAFELGVRIALNRPVCIIRAIGMTPFFDVDNMMRVYEYSPNLWTSTLKHDVSQLTDHIKASWENKNLASYMDILTGKVQSQPINFAIPQMN